MVFRITGILLIVISVGAVIAQFAELALPTLDWFFSFDSKEKELVEASWWAKNQAGVIGYALCSVLLAVGVLALLSSLRTKSREVNWNPQTLRKLKRFKSITRGYVSLWILAGLLLVTLLDHASGVHDGHLVAGLRHDPHVVSDDKDRSSGAALKLLN